MRSNKSLSLILSTIMAAGLLMACGADDDDKVDADGLYYLESTFSTPRGIPDADSNELGLFLDLSGRPDRVGSWLLELLEDELDSPYKSALKYARNGLDTDEEFQQFLEEDAPELVESLATLATDVESVTTSINLLSELELTTDQYDDKRGVADHYVTGVIYRVDGEEYRYDLAELGVSTPPGMSTDFILHDRKDGYENVISFGSQAVDLQYGRMIDYAINQLVAENADPFSDSFTDLMTTLVPCKSAGKWLEEKIGSGSSEIYGVACAAAMEKLAEKMLPLEITEMDVIIDFNGDAELVETNDRNDRIDGLTRGEWEGTLSYPSQTINLRRPSHTFFGNRSRARRNNDDDVR